MTLDEAQQAAGVTFDGNGDSASYPTKLPAGDAHPFVDSGPDGHVFCIGVSRDQSTTQTVVTPEGFMLGQPLSKLRTVYGNRLVHVPKPAQGIGPTDGYIVAEPGGLLAFPVSGDTVEAITAGINGFDGKSLTPSSCTD
jgi:hypothetical protein